jgi:hypothetical protein
MNSAHARPRGLRSFDDGLLDVLLGDHPLGVALPFEHVVQTASAMHVVVREVEQSYARVTER